MNRFQLINKLITKNNYSRYLEIGIESGFCFNNVKCTTKYGVDPAAKIKVSYPITSDEFFEKHAPTMDKFDIIFIDGLHHSEQVDKDIKNSLDYLNEGGTIVLHDCNPLTKGSQEVPRIQTHWHGDVWKSIVKFKNSSDIGCLVIDADCGLGVINQNIPKGKSLNLPNDLTYEWLCDNRKDALNLVNIKESESLLY